AGLLARPNPQAVPFGQATPNNSRRQHSPHHHEECPGFPQKLGHHPAGRPAPRTVYSLASKPLLEYLDPAGCTEGRGDPGMALRGWIVRGVVSAAIALACAAPEALACGPSVVDRVRITKADAPADAQLERVRSSLTSRTAGENLAGTSLRVLTVRPRPEDATRFDATLYDDSL